MASSVALTTTHLPRLRAILDQWRAAQPPFVGFATDSQELAQKSPGHHETHKDVIVAFHGGEAAHSHVEFCPGVTATGAEPVFWNGPTLTHKVFKADLAFGPDVDNEEVYLHTVVANDFLPLVIGGGVGCVLSYGQTASPGSGKTFTMEGFERLIARDLFKAADVAARRSYTAEKSLRFDTPEVSRITADDGFTFEVTFLELIRICLLPFVRYNSPTL
ncbi:hypothetical protein AURDEDRAFT_157430 [Auricularia subglabra TFB-10046 SS5]|nr:hypothetical protein AURDEDRAFT_157430 [Auricularia subglabra TFB-10046 SS5]